MYLEQNWNLRCSVFEIKKKIASVFDMWCA